MGVNGALRAPSAPYRAIGDFRLWLRKLGLDMDSGAMDSASVGFGSISDKDCYSTGKSRAYRPL